MTNTIQIKKSNGKRILQFPDDLILEDDRYLLKKVGNIVYLVPVNDPWSGMFEAVNDFTEDYIATRNQPELEKRPKLN